MPRISAKQALVVILLLGLVAVAAGCKPKESKAPAVPPGPPATGQTAAPGELSQAQPGAPATEAPPAAAQPVSVGSEIILKCGDVELGMPLTDIRTKYTLSKNNMVKEEWVTPDDTGTMSVLLGVKEKSSEPGAAGPMETMQFFFKGGKLVGFHHAKTNPGVKDLEAWAKQNGPDLPAPGTALPEFAKDVDICNIFTQADPSAQNAIWANDSMQTLLGAHLQPEHILVEVLVDVKQYQQVMKQLQKATPAGKPGALPPPKGAK